MKTVQEAVTFAFSTSILADSQLDFFSPNKKDRKRSFARVAEEEVEGLCGSLRFYGKKKLALEVQQPFFRLFLEVVRAHAWTSTLVCWRRPTSLHTR